MSLRIGIDTGGTFTDVVAIDERSGALYAVKTPSTPADPSVALLNGVAKVLQASGNRPIDVGQLLHGSTVATNAVLEHKFDGLGLLVTQGFRHLIEIARQSVPDGYGNSYLWVKPPRLVPLHLVREVPGRVGPDGSEIAPLEESAALAAVGDLARRGVRCIGVCLLHAYANDAHERRVGELIARHHPRLFVSLSSVVLPEYREYERAMTTLIDVLVKPYCKTYLQSAADKIRAEAGDVSFLIMQSNGGVVKHATAAHKPVTMLLSGPAAGVLGSIHMARLAGFEDILTIDVGGTSTDVAIVEKLRPKLTSYSLVEHYPVKTPMLDIVSVGSGGGSIAWLDPYGSLKVGPRSAGADPGPICYGRGGTAPTVTDAAIVLGRLPPALIGGEIRLDRETARGAYTALGAKFGMRAEEVAAGVLEIAAANQVHGIRQVTTTRGRDPQRYAMVAFGGAGGLFAAEVADFLQIRTIVSPPNPGNLCAFGLHVSDVKRDYIRTLVRQRSKADQTEIETVWRELEATGLADIEAEDVPAARIALHRSADLRYVGEGHEVQVDITHGLEGDAAIEAMWSSFHRVHRETFGYDYEGEQDVELVNLRVQAVGVVHRPNVAEKAGAAAAPTPVATRQVYWRDGGWIDCAIHRRDDLAAGATMPGPIIVEEYGSTVVVPRSWSIRPDRYGNLILEKLP